MAITVVNTATAGSADGGKTAVASAVDMSSGGPADTLIVAVASDSAHAAIPSDSLNGLTYSALTNFTRTSGAVGVQLFYKKNATVSSSMTFTITFDSATAVVPSFVVLGAKGADLSAPLDGNTGTNGTSNWTTLDLASAFTPTAASELVVTALAFDVSTVPTVSDLTSNNTLSAIVTTNLAGGQNYGIALSYVIQTSAVSIQPRWSAPSNSGSLALASFKIAAAGGSNWGPFILSQDWNRLVRS